MTGKADMGAILPVGGMPNVCRRQPVIQPVKTSVQPTSNAGWNGLAISSRFSQRRPQSPDSPPPRPLFSWQRYLVRTRKFACSAYRRLFNSGKPNLVELTTQKWRIRVGRLRWIRSTRSYMNQRMSKGGECGKRPSASRSAPDSNGRTATDCRRARDRRPAER